MNIALEIDIFTPQNYDIDRESNLTVTEFVPQSPFNDLAFWKFIPSSLDVNKSPIVVVHGIFRGAESQLKAFSDIAQRTGRLLIAPFFCTTQWNGYQRPGRRCKSDTALIQLFGYLKLSGLMKSRQVTIFGYSAGAQFAHRFALRFPQRVESLHLCSAGWYTALNAQPYPAGLGTKKNAVSRDSGFELLSNVNPFLQIPTTVFVGANDTEIDINCRSNDDLNLTQGNNRLERAIWWVSHCNSQRKNIGLSGETEIIVLSDAAHDFGECVKSGLTVYIEKSLQRLNQE